MTREQYALLENCMRKCMRGCDGAHDAEHVYRVLGVGLDIVAHEPGADADVVVAAAFCMTLAAASSFKTEDLPRQGGRRPRQKDF